MRFRILLSLPLLLAGLAGAAWSQEPAAPPSQLPSYAEPSVSPDAQEVAFVSAGDIWTVPIAGGEARLLVSHPASESRPLYSPDGSRLLFSSSRTGNGDLYVLTLATGDLRRITFDDAADYPDSWSRDGRWLYFTSSSRDIGGMQDVYRVSAEGGTPTIATGDRFAAEYFGAPSPDGKTLAFTGRGTGTSQWWRAGHSHLDESEIWLRREDGRYERLSEKRSEKGAREMWPMWAPDGRTVYYVSDRTGAPNLWSRTPDGSAKQQTHFTGGRVLWPAMAAGGRVIVFERDLEIWKWEVGKGEPAAIPITRRGVAAGPSVERLSLGSGFQDLSISRDGKKVAFSVRGEVFAASAKDGGDAVRVTLTPASESQVQWAPDNRRLAYVSDRGGSRHLYLYDFTTTTETPLTQGEGDDDAPDFSPDGKLLAYIRSGRELRVLELETKTDRQVLTGRLPQEPYVSPRWMAWSPDAQWLAVILPGVRGFQNVYVVPAAGGEKRPVTFFANAQSSAVAWSPDGKFLVFGTGQRTEDFALARVDLQPHAPKFREDQFRELFQEGQKPSPDKQPVKIDFEDIRRRVSLVPVGLDVDAATISPDGKWILVTGTRAGQSNLYLYSLDELARDGGLRQLTTSPGFKQDAQFTGDSKEVYYLEGGRINAVSVDTRTPRSVAVTAELSVDFAQEKLEVFHQAWTYLRDHFFDPAYNGVDWNAVRERYRPRVAGARTAEELRRILSLMVGELNASHLGVGAPGGLSVTTGRLGLRFDGGEYESSGRLKVTEVIALGPAALAGGIATGDYVLAVDGQEIDARTSLDALMEYKTGRRVVLTVASAPNAETKREVAIRPTTRLAERTLLYRQWVESRRQYVHQVSGGKLGYVHIPDMTAPSLAQFHLDLDAENQAREGVVIDIRNNQGGFVNAYALDVLSRRPYLTLTPRGYEAPVPARVSLGQRALEAPTILVTNQHSLSDAEDFTEGYRALKLGKVVGEPTAGWIIYTSDVPLVDGSSLRLPGTRVRDSEGKDMENHPRPVDIAVEYPLGESYTGKDSQLDAAVRELLRDVERKRR